MSKHTYKWALIAIGIALLLVGIWSGVPAVWPVWASWATIVAGVVALMAGFSISPKTSDQK